MSADLIACEREVGLQDRLIDLIPLLWPIVEPGRPYYTNWHIEAMAEHLEAVHKGDIRRLVINVPPGCSKSLTVSVFWPTWIWLRDPRFRFIVASYDGALTIRDARRQLQILSSPWFKERFGDRVSLSGDIAAGDFTLLQGGFRYSTSVAGPVTGRHADVQIVDDPIKPGNLTKNALNACIDWWTTTMPSRMGDPKTGRRVLIMQRLHDDDLAGYCIRTGDYEVLRLPMRFEKKACSYTKIGGDLRSEDGELLWPDRLPEEDVARMEREMSRELSAFTVAAQMQQSPVPTGGAIFLKEWFRYYDDIPTKFDQLIQSWDCAFKGSDTSDYVVGQVWGAVGESYYLVDCVRRRMNFPQTLQAFRDLTVKWPRATIKLVEDKANGPALISSLDREISGIVPINPAGGKESRANAVTGLYEAGNVYHPRAPWISDHEEELLRFPFGSHDDSVDAATQALVYLRSKQSRYLAALGKIKDFTLY